MKSYKTETHKSTLGCVVCDACSDLTELGEELRAICDNTPDSLQGTSAHETRDTTAGELENVSEPDVPAEAADAEVTYSIAVPKRKGRAASRSTRCGNAVSMLQAAIEVMEERKAAAEADEGKSAEELAEALGQCIDECQEIVDACESLEFPGMYG